MAPSASPFSKSPSSAPRSAQGDARLAAGLNKYAGYFARGVTALLTGYLASR
uniref:hypothetical protein n=1 Tax=Bradyrhizobium guangxiense TaxID=1325115 RepID=UPI0037043A50